ncbi:GNAT family N-acetyltransferase [Microbacterium sp. NPDC076911]|uniref:GNAT family N-acetyltransferase n=1 Tax=Microbacterium sp. NPDC076911 TaxID=3154958 RepID=UPI0034346CBE
MHSADSGMIVTAIPGVSFRPLHIPLALDRHDASDFVAMVHARNAIYLEISGHNDEAVTPDELLPHYQPNSYERRVAWVIVVDDEIVGRVGLDLPLEKGSVVAFWLIEILRAHWGRGIGSAAHRLVEQFARSHERTTLQSWATHPHCDGPVLEPRTGFGTIPDDHVARFYARHGYALEQVERNSAFDMTAPFDQVERLLKQSRAASTDYRVLQWDVPTPADYVDGYAWMKSRMSTDTPAGALDFDEERWDAERIAQHDARYTAAGCTLQVTAAQHIRTGELCAFNELMIPKDQTLASHQEDTLVLKEHRGRKLGTLVKCAGLIAWRERMPHSARVLTYNAEENRPMLDINEAIGFKAIAYVGAWKKGLVGISDSSDSNGS